MPIEKPGFEAERAGEPVEIRKFSIFDKEVVDTIFPSPESIDAELAHIDKVIANNKREIEMLTRGGDTLTEKIQLFVRGGKDYAEAIRTLLSDQIAESEAAIPKLLELKETRFREQQSAGQ